MKAQALKGRQFPEPEGVDLWAAVCSDETITPATLNRLSYQLDEAEREHCGRFRHTGSRRQYICARALLRHALSRREVDIEPASWRYRRTPSGKLELAESHVHTGLRFNLSHSGDVVVCAIAHHRTVGVDVEWINRSCECKTIAERYFAPAECQALLALPDDQIRAAFFDFWTLKEAYVKALGHGLSYPLEKFFFSLKDGNGISITDANDSEASRKWAFFLLPCFDRYRIAVCTERFWDSERPYFQIHKLVVSELAYQLMH